ncbi:MAG: T9SS type A sorting domain-containing protein [Bacteroidota bacterium]
MKSAAGGSLTGESSLFVYPNPGKGIFNLRLEKELQGVVNLKITNALGAIVYEEKGITIDKAMSKTIDLSGLSNGIYILSAEGEQEVIQKKIILNK